MDEKPTLYATEKAKLDTHLVYTYVFCIGRYKPQRVEVYRDTPEQKCYTEDDGFRLSEPLEVIEHSRKDVILKSLRELDVPRDQLKALSWMMSQKEDAIIHPDKIVETRFL